MKSEDQRIFENHLMTETDQLITSFSRIRWAAMCEEENVTFMPRNSKYKWEIGRQVYMKILSDTHLINVENVKGKVKKTIMGWPFIVNDDEKDSIRLWREVEA